LRELGCIVKCSRRRSAARGWLGHAGAKLYGTKLYGTKLNRTNLDARFGGNAARGDCYSAGEYNHSFSRIRRHDVTTDSDDTRIIFQRNSEHVVPRRNSECDQSQHDSAVDCKLHHIDPWHFAQRFALWNYAWYAKWSNGFYA
jgi:hypothetical protein